MSLLTRRPIYLCLLMGGCAGAGSHSCFVIAPPRVVATAAGALINSVVLKSCALGEGNEGSASPVSAPPSSTTDSEAATLQVAGLPSHIVVADTSGWPRFLLDGTCVRLAKWLRALGIDAAIADEEVSTTLASSITAFSR